MKNDTAKGCTRKSGTQCRYAGIKRKFAYRPICVTDVSSLFHSPSQGPCCSSESCQFVPLSKNVQCKAESDCSYNSTCNGRSSECPPPLPRANKTRCNEGTQVKRGIRWIVFCFFFFFFPPLSFRVTIILLVTVQLCINGECTGSICLEWNLTECFLTSNVIPNIDKRKLCELACQNGTDPSTCRSTSEFAHVVGLPEGGISLRPGSPCDNFQVKKFLILYLILYYKPMQMYRLFVTD